MELLGCAGDHLCCRVTHSRVGSFDFLSMMLYLEVAYEELTCDKSNFGSHLRGLGKAMNTEVQFAAGTILGSVFYLKEWKI